MPKKKMDLYGKKFLYVWECPRCTEDPDIHGQDYPVLSLIDWCPKCIRKIPKENKKIVWSGKERKARWTEIG